MELITTFNLVLFLTLLITRIFAHNFHDMKKYGTKQEKSKTLTGLLRRITGVDIHHYYFGILILIIVLPTFLFQTNHINIAFLAIGISLFIDQAIPILDKKICYFDRRTILLSVASHIIISIFSIIFFNSSLYFFPMIL
jgi:hypothetical protein